MGNNQHKVIVIGAGISGIGASKTLTAHKIPHLILQARDRIGGRIASCEFEGCQVQLGAAFVHSPKRPDNYIAKYISQNEWPIIQAESLDDFTYYENEGLFKDEGMLQKVQEIIAKFQEKAEQIFEQAGEDLPLQKALDKFIQKDLQDQPQKIKDFVRFFINLQSNVDGLNLKQLSVKSYVEDQDIRQEDYSPEGGYSKVLKALFEQCKCELKLNQRVTSVNYSGQRVIVTTEKDKFECDYVIAGFPLGILQQQKVSFEPYIPQDYSDKLKRMGCGIVNKIYASFNESFWDESQGWLNFVTKGQKESTFPNALIVPKTNKPILCFFVSASNSLNHCQQTEEQVKENLEKFLTKVVGEDIHINKIMMTRWQEDENSLGSYSCVKVGQKQKQWSKKLRQPLDGKVWLIGEHLHPDLYGCVSAAYETGVWAAEQVINQLQKLQNH